MATPSSFYGKSSPPKKFHLDYYREDAEVAHKMMETLGYTSYSLLGWCDGGKTAMTMAGLYRKAGEKLVIWGCGAYLTERERDCRLRINLEPLV